MASWVERVVGAARLNVATYEEVEADKGANWQAMSVVILSAICAGIGGVRAGGAGIVAGTIGALLGWVLWAALVWLIGTKMLPTKETVSDVGELLRTTGFAAGPGMIRILGVLPLLGWIANWVAWIWMLATMVVAVRQALDYPTTGRAILVCAIGWVIVLAATLWAAALIGVALFGAGAMHPSGGA
ncbi:MAG TPA: YIP1 family protein [Candidatus Eisenbacteria bacterium]